MLRRLAGDPIAVAVLIGSVLLVVVGLGLGTVFVVVLVREGLWPVAVAVVILGLLPVSRWVAGRQRTPRA